MADFRAHSALLAADLTATGAAASSHSDLLD
jgi:hypothetical protein